MAPVDLRRSTVFGKYAEEYERWRPSYAPDAVDWLVPQGATHVADVGAGTGRLTGLLLERGLTVEAVEPDRAMLDVLGRRHPTAHAHQSGAERLLLSDASMDAVLVADAWHWFPHEQALQEAGRVLRPDGWLGLVWNRVAPAERWEFELHRIDPDHSDGDGHPVVPGLAQESIETATFPWTWDLTPDHWRGYLATHSAVAVMEDADRAKRLDAAH